MNQHKLLYLWIIFGLFICSPTQAFALTVLPSKVYVTTRYNDISRKTFIVKNDYKSKVKIRIFCQELIIKNAGKNISFKTPAPGDKKALSNFITIIPDNFILGPLEKKNVEMLIETPKTIFGGNTVSIFFESEDYNPVKKIKLHKMLNIRTSVAAYLFQETEGTVEAKSKITGVKVIDQTISQPLAINLDVINLGNTIIKGSALISILDENYKYLGKIEVPQKILVENEKTTLTGNYNIKLQKGNYRALITYQYKDKNITIEKSFSVK
jgi:hypothetical protein